jgi:flagellar basal body rod protein FlgC
MNGVSATAVSELTASSMWMDAIASNIANARDEGPIPPTPRPGQSRPPRTAPTRSISRSRPHSTAYRANIAVVKAADKMMQAALDMIA